MRDVEGIENLGLGDALGAALDHEDRVLGAGDDQVHLKLCMGLLVGVDDEVTLELADPDGADERLDRNRGDRESRGGGVHREDVIRVDTVDRERLGDQLGLVVPALREEGADRAVDHARRQRRLLAGPRLAAEERARDLARGVVLLLDVDGQREEVDIAEVAHRRCAEDHGVTAADDHGAAGLTGELAGLEGDLLATDLGRDAAHVKHTHVFGFSFRRPGWRANVPELLVL